MLIGVGGSGKQSLTRLSSFINNAETMTLEIVKGFNQEKFREFIKELFIKTGIDGTFVSFLFLDT